MEVDDDGHAKIISVGVYWGEEAEPKVAWLVDDYVGGLDAVDRFDGRRYFVVEES